MIDSFYFFSIFFAFLFYYLFRKFLDDSLPLLPIIYYYKNIDDVINGIEIVISMTAGAYFGYFVYWLINKIFEFELL